MQLRVALLQTLKPGAMVVHADGCRLQHAFPDFRLVAPFQYL